MVEGKAEIWKTWTPFPFVKGSTLGKVKTLDRYVEGGKGGKRFVKGRILKQRHNRNGYLQVVFNPDGHQINRSVHRIIAECFLSNPNNLPQVNHKNCVRDDNRVVNLEWCSASYNARYREKYGESIAEQLSRPVYAINLGTVEVLKFKSRSEAGRELGIVHQNISAVITGKLKQAGNFWFTEDDSVWVIKDNKDKLSKIVAGKKPNYSVFAVNLVTQEVRLFPSQSEAGRTIGAEQSTITKVVNGKRNKTKNYWFTNADNEAANNAKIKLPKLLGDRFEYLKAGDTSKETADFIANCIV